MYSAAARAYKRVDLESAPKTQILDRLFARLLGDLAGARVAFGDRDIKAKAALLDHASAIVNELNAALDHDEAPELCANLASLYGYVQVELGNANLSLDAIHLDRAGHVVTEIRAAFATAAENA